MNESNQKQKVVSILLTANKKKAKSELIEYPEINTLLDEGMYVESFNQCRLTGKKVCLTFVLRYYH